MGINYILFSNLLKQILGPSCCLLCFSRFCFYGLGGARGNFFECSGVWCDCPRRVGAMEVSLIF